MRGDYESGEASSSTWPEQNDDEVKKMEKPQQRDAEQLMRDADRLMMLNEIGRTVSTQQDLPSVLESIYQQARQRLQIDSFYVSLYHPETNEISYPILYDEGEKYEKETIAAYDDHFVVKIVQSGKPIWINRTEEELIVPPGQKEMLGNMARKSASLMYIPLVAPEAIIGVISVQSYTLNAYDEDDLALLSGIGYHVAVAVENARLVSALRHELSERKKAEAEVLRAQAERENLIQELELRNTELERFAYTVSHDLKTPLITIGGFLGYLEIDARRGDLDELDSDIQNIKSAVGKMGLLLDELLELSRIGRMMNKPEMIPYLDIVQDALALTHGRLAEKHIQVSVQSAFPSVLVDKARLVEVVQNLVENAAKYMGDQTDPHIWIGVDETSGRQIFTVRDNGVGIASAHHEQIFGLFNKLNPDGEGTGIGLALVKRIVEVHNGRLWVESDGLGQGSTFFFTLNET